MTAAIRRNIWTAMVITVALLILQLIAPGAARGVVNGEPAREGELPFMAAVQDGSGFTFCGGSVIASGWVLTAAHCVEDGDASGLYVVTGRADLSDTSRGQRIKVSAVHVHPRYDNGTHDAALLRLSTTTTAAPIALAGSGDDDLEAPGTPVTVAGWGDQLPTMGLFATDQLHRADLEVVSDGECGRTNVGFDAATGVCAAAFLRDSCQGDSGGPLWGTKDGARVQIGVVSYGMACALPAFPGVYSEVNNTSIRSWISATAGV